MDLAVIDRKARAVVCAEDIACRFIGPACSVIVDITAADKNVLTVIKFDCADAAFIDVGVRDVEPFAAVGYNTGRTAAVKSAEANISVRTVFHKKEYVNR